MRFVEFGRAHPVMRRVACRNGVETVVRVSTARRHNGGGSTGDAGDTAFDSRFLRRWCDANGVFLDRRATAVLPLPGGFGGRGVFAAQDIAAGELVATIPATATLRRSDLYRPTMAGGTSHDADGADWRAGPGYFPTPAAAEDFCTALLSVQRGRMPGVVAATDAKFAAKAGGVTWSAMGDEEATWWELAVVVAAERQRPASRFRSYLEDCLPARPIDWAAAFFHQRDVLLGGLPPEAIARLGNVSKHRHAVAAVLARAAIATMDVTATPGAAAPAADAFAADLAWAFDIVASRANNFSLSMSHATDMPRPYGVVMTGAGGEEHAIPGAEPTLCPVFDLLNHAALTNVLVADCRMRPPPRRMFASDAANAPFSVVQRESQVPCLVIGALGPIPRGAQLVYRYNAPRTVAGGVDLGECLARWGFVPTER